MAINYGSSGINILQPQNQRNNVYPMGEAFASQSFQH